MLASHVACTSDVRCIASDTSRSIWNVQMLKEGPGREDGSFRQEHPQKKSMRNLLNIS